jgi:hypothetical protein
VGLRRWGTALPVLWSGKMRLLCGRELLEGKSWDGDERKWGKS